MEHRNKSMRDVVGILQRRKIPMLLVAVFIALVGVTLAFTLPASYRSTATILIEEQEIPSDIVRSAITTYADQRIETIKQQIMTRSTLWRIVEQYGLYSSLRKNSPTEEVLARFTKDIRVDVINAKVIDKRTQSATQATIAFTLAYDGESPTATSSRPKARTAPSMTFVRGGPLRRALCSAPSSDPIAKQDVSTPKEPAPVWKTCLATKARVIWKLNPKVPTMKTMTIGTSRFGRSRT